MKLEQTPFAGVVMVSPTVYKDDRGYFYESYHESVFRSLGLPTSFKQDNQASSSKGVLRGLHYQLKFTQGKLVSVILGEVFDVAVDIRKGSPTFGQYFCTYLSEMNKRMIYIPKGFAHGYCVLSERAIFQYKCKEIYHPEDEYGIHRNDPELAINWPMKDPVLSEKDNTLPLLSKVRDSHLPNYEDAHE